MARINEEQDGMESGTFGKNHFKFSGIRTELLGASELTIVNIVVDTTGSVWGFQDQLRDCVIAAVNSCKKSPRSENILVRVALFNTGLPTGIEEIHGFKPLAEINTADYPAFKPGGETNLYDATYSAVGAMNAYAKRLHDDDFAVNGINFIITDGSDNKSVMKPASIAEEILNSRKDECLESVINILIGINTAIYADKLDKFKEKAELDHFIDAGDVTERKLAKIAEFVSQSVSSQSQAMGTGGPSQNINPNI